MALTQRRDAGRGPGLAAGLAAAALGTAAATTAWLAARRRDVDRLVAPDLRHPALYLPITYDASTLALLRRLDPGTSVPLAVSHERREVPATATAPAVPLHLYRPRSGQAAAGARGAAVLFLHGGGFVSRGPAQYHGWCARLAERLGVAVVGVDYRLAPETPFPGPLDDCHAALLWLREHADELGVDPSRIAVVGDSAGGGLAACLAQRAHDEGIDLAFQALVHPMLDDRTCLREPAGGQGEFVWTPASNRFGWTSYLGRPPSDAGLPPYAAASRRVDLAGLPPAWIGVGDLDLFLTEDRRYAERLQAAGVPVQLDTVPGMYHGADQLLPEAPSIRRLTDAMVRALAGALGVTDTLGA